MPTFEFTSPDGKTYEVSGPEGATKEQAFQILMSHKPELRGGAQGKPPTSDPVMQNAEALQESYAGPPWIAGTQQDIFNRQQEIEKRLRAAGKSDEEIQSDPEWQRTAKDLSRSVSAAGTETALNVAGTELIPVGRGIGTLVGKGAGLVKGAFQGTKPALDAVTDIGPATNKSTLGQKMYSDLSTRVNKLLKTRSDTAIELKREYLSEGATKEKEVAQEYQGYLKSLIDQRLHPAQAKIVAESARNIENDPSIETLIIERRRLNDIANSDPSGGYNEVDRQMAGNLAANLTKTLREKVPSYGRFLDKYAELSHPIDLFQDTALGKRITKETSDFLPDVPYYDPKTLPDNMFKSKHSIQLLRQLAGGDEKMVKGAASEHVATSLQNLNATQARAWLEKNREWLEEIPSVEADAEKYVANLEKVSHTTERSRKLLNAAGAGAAATVGGGVVYRGLRELGFAP